MGAYYKTPVASRPCSTHPSRRPPAVASSCATRRTATPRRHTLRRLGHITRKPRDTPWPIAGAVPIRQAQPTRRRRTSTDQTTQRESPRTFRSCPVVLSELDIDALEQRSVNASERSVHRVGAASRPVGQVLDTDSVSVALLDQLAVAFPQLADAVLHRSFQRIGCLGHSQQFRRARRMNTSLKTGTLRRRC